MVARTIVAQINAKRFKDDGTEEFGFFAVGGNSSELDANRITRVLDATEQINYNWYDISNFSSQTAAQGTVTVATPEDGDIVTINDLDYTARDTPVNPGDFLIDVGDDNTNTAENLTAVINADTRVGGIGYVFATSAATVVTVASALSGAEGNGTTLDTTNDTRLNVDPDTGFFNNGSAGSSNLNFEHRTVRVPKDFTFTKIAGFFNNFNTSSTDVTLIAIPLRNEDAFIEYSIFLLWISATTGTVSVDLYFGTTEIVQGQTPDFPNIPTNSTQVGEHLVQRSIKAGVGGTVDPTDPPTGLTRVYDYFQIVRTP